MTDAYKRVAARIDTYREVAIDLERKLTKAPAISPESGGNGERAKAEILEKELRAIGLEEIVHYDAPDDRAAGGARPNLSARLAGRTSGSRLWVMSHLDVVPEGDLSKWSSDPWTVRVEGDKVYGRGVEDNQQGVVSSVLAARALLEEKVVPERDLCLLFVADEETGSKLGIRHVLETAAPFGKNDLIITPDGGRPDGSQIEVAEKGILWVKLTVTGRQTHASTPERGNNAHRAAAHLVVALDALRERFPARDEVFDPPISTFEPTKREPNVPSVNIIPGEEVFYLDCRLLPRYTIEELEGEIAAISATIESRFGVTIAREAAQREAPAPATPPDAPVVRALQKAVAEVYGVQAKPEGIGGGTVAAYIRRAGFPAAVWARMDETMHGPDEYALVSNLLGDAKVFAHLALQRAS